jgi:SAM-dependent methyltransferase
VALRTVVTQFLPPIVVRALKRTKRLLSGKAKAVPSDSVGKQDLETYWDPGMADVLDHWGEGTVWNEIQMLLATCSGATLDIACGTGRTIQINSANGRLELHGCDISDLMIGKALERGIQKERLRVCDATKSGYADDQFEFGYSIGSLEHFTSDGIDQFVRETKRIIRQSSFHMVPVSRSGKDEGWLKTLQSFHNNSVAWWKSKFDAVYGDVRVLDSAWMDDLSTGKWFVCRKAI